MATELPPRPATTPAAKAAPLPVDPKILAEVKHRYGDEDEIITAAKKAGVDYLPLVARCMQRDPLAMSAMFQLTLKLKTGGEGAEANATVLSDLLRDVGDRWFAQCLSSQPAEIQERIRVSILYDMGIESSTEDLANVRDLFPKTFPKSWHPEWSADEEKDEETADDDDSDDDDSQDLMPDAPVRRI